MLWIYPLLGHVDCSSDNMNIVIQKSYLESLGYDGQSLYVNDQYCRPRVSSYQVVFSFPINSCGTVRKVSNTHHFLEKQYTVLIIIILPQIMWLFFNTLYLEQFENGRIVYHNTVRAYTSNYGEITRQSHFRMNVGCRMEQDSVSQIMYVVEHHDNSSITGTGRFNTSMDFYTSSSFYYKVCLGDCMHRKLFCKYFHTMLTFCFHALRSLEILTRCYSTRTCMSKWTWGGVTAPWFSFLTPVWPHHHPMTSIADLITWSVMGKMRVFNSVLIRK